MKPLSCILLSLFLVTVEVAVGADPPPVGLTKILPLKIGGFRQAGSAKPVKELIRDGVLNPGSATTANSAFVAGEVEYLSQTGNRYLVELVQFRKDADAYSLLTLIAERLRHEAGTGQLDEQVGTASAVSSQAVSFFKGVNFVRVSRTKATENSSGELLPLAKLIADSLDKGEGDIPVLVKHLPDWPEAQKRALYLSAFSSLQSVAPDQPVLAALDPAGDPDAVAADYGSAKLLIVEFNTPQLAADNDRLIQAKLEQLKNESAPRPTSYRRVGNYSVFVFNAESEQAANALIDKIQYEQVVQWLGDNPYWLKEAQRRYTETTLGVLVAVVKASGLTLFACFGLGGLIGTVLFMRRRARQASAEAFSDAGGMLRLNLDELTPQTDPSRLLADRN